MSIPRPETFRILLRRYRIAAGLTQEQLAERAQLSARTIGNLERGGPHQPRGDSLRLLAEALDLSPEQHAAFMKAVGTLRAHDAPQLPLPPGAAPHNLPASPTPLIGREHEVAAACALLRRPDVRLLTLSGPPGTGKTRLGVQVASELLDEFSDGVSFIALAPIRDPDQVIPTIAQALGVRESAALPLAQALRVHLAPRQLLLLLDNFEQVLAAAPQIGQILGACSRVKALITSREALHLRGEHELVVPPLALPDPQQPPAAEDLAQYAAVALFAERARAARSNFALTPTSAPVVAEICRRLDGLPLAIELAAARIKVLPLPALLARLDHRLRLLTGGAQDLPERQRTLQRAIAWSYDLLSPDEQRLFRQLAVFVGGCALDAAEAVCAATGDLVTDVLAGLAALIDKSLLYQEGSAADEPRFGMLETIREYAFEHLEVSGEVESMRQRHASYFVTLAETAEPALTGPAQAQWYARLAAEQDNLRAVLRWAREQAATGPEPRGALRDAMRSGAVELGLRLAGTLGMFWRVRGPVSEGRAWLEEMLPLTTAAETASEPLAAGARIPVAPAVRARACLAAGWLAEHHEDLGPAGAWLEESLRLYQELGDISGTATALNYLAVVALDAADYGRAQVRFEECLRLRRELGDTRSVASTLGNLGVVAMHQGDYPRAAAWLQDALLHLEEVGDSASPTLVMGSALLNLAVVMQYQGHYRESEALIEQGLALFRQLRATVGIAVALHHLGNVAREQGNAPRAIALYSDSLDLYQADARPHTSGIVHCLEDIARLALAEGQAAQAARLWGAVEALRAGMAESARPPGELRRYERDIAALRVALARERFAAAWDEGQAMSLDQTIAAALSTRPAHAHRRPVEHDALP